MMDTFRSINGRLKQSRLFQLDVNRKSRLDIPITIALYFLLWVAGLLLGRAAASLAAGLPGLSVTAAGSLVVSLKRIITCGIQIAFFLIWVRFVEKRSLRSLGFPAGKSFQAYFSGFIIGLCAISMISLILTLSGAVRLEYRHPDAGAMVLNVGMLALAWAVQSASEEIAVRGWLIPRLGSRWNPVGAIALTALIFGILHLFTSGVTVLSFVNLTLSGVFFAAYAIYTENIWGVCGLHFAWNFSLGNLYGFSVSGFAENGDTVLKATQIGSDFLTGGDFGPEGGFVTTVLLIAAVGLTARKLYTKFHPVSIQAGEE